MAIQRNETERKARANMLEARSSLMHNLPFFGTLSLSLKTIVDYTVRSIATDGVSLKHNPEWVAAATPQQVKSALAACVVSCAFHHHIRREQRSYGRWQKACNLAITPMLIQQGLLSGEEGQKMSAERAYDQLEEETKEEQAATVSTQQHAEGQCDQPGQSGAAQQHGPGQTGKNQTQEDQQQQDNNAGPSQDGKPQKPDETQEEWDQNDPSGHLGEVQDFPGETPEEIEESANKWIEATLQCIQLAKQQGLNPGDLSEHVAALLEPTIDWRSALRNLLTEHINTRDTWARPNRRFAATGPYLPGKEPHGAPPIALAVDTSGSMSNKELSEVWAEVRECTEVMEPEFVRIIQCDAAVVDDETYKPDELPLELAARGRGGTRFTPVFDLLERAWGEEEIGCLIYLSDLYCNDYPRVPPEYPVIWVGSSNASEIDPPFGTRIDIEP